MRILYLTHFDPLRPTTNRISDLRFCEGLAENGCDVEYIAPYLYRSYNIARADVLSAYGIEHPFRVTILPTPLWEGASKWYYVPVLVGFAFPAYLAALARGRGAWDETYVLSRDVNLLVPVLLAKRALFRGGGPKVIHWAHEIKPDDPQYRWVYDRVDGLIGTSSALVDDLHERLGTPREKLAVTLNPISTRQLRERRAGAATKRDVRRRLGLPSDRPLVVYTGKLGPDVDEIPYILKAAARLPGCTFVLTGGKPSAVEHFEAYCRAHGIENVIFSGFLDRYTDVLDYQVAADVLVSYYTTRDHIVDYNYPQKITEYMLAGNPIVTPEYRATQDVLDDTNAFFVAPEDPAALVEGIERVLADPERARAVGEKAWEDVQALTFKERTRRLMDFFRTL